MSIGQIIKDLADKKNLSASGLAKQLGLTRQAVYGIYEKDDVSTAIIRKCAEIFGVPPSYFFGDRGTGAVANGHSIAAVNSTVNSNDTSCKEKVALLEALLEEKERTIQILLNK